MKHLARLAALLALIPALALGQISTGPGIVGGLVVGAQVVGGTATRVLYVDSSGNLAGSANLTFNGSTLNITASGTESAPSLTWGAQTTTGFYRGAANQVYFDALTPSFRLAQAEVHFVSNGIVTWGDKTNTFASETTDLVVKRYAAKQLMISGDGVGATTNAGMTIGYIGVSGYGGITNSALTLGSSTAGLIVGAAGDTFLVSGAQPITFRLNSADKMVLSNTAGAGPAITAGTAGSAVSAETISQTRNFNTSATDYLKYSFTLTSTHASDNIFAYYGGAGGVTSLLRLSTVGALVGGDNILNGTGRDFGDVTRALFHSPADGVMTVVANDGITAGVYGWATAGGAAVTGLSQISAGVIGVGTGAAGSVAGTLQAATVTAGTSSTIDANGLQVAAASAMYWTGRAVLKSGADGVMTVSNNAQTRAVKLQMTGTPTCSSNCGTSPSVVGVDSAGTVTMGGTGSPASGWVLTFNGTWSAAPACHVSPALAGMAVGKLPIVVATTTTTMTVTTNGTAPANSDVYTYVCTQGV